MLLASAQKVVTYCVSLLNKSLHTIAETQCWQDWLLFADIFFFLMKSGCIDFLDFVDKLASRVTNSDQQILRSNHVTWLLAQIIRIEIVMNTLSSDPRKVMYICMTLFKFNCFCYSINSMQLIS